MKRETISNQNIKVWFSPNKGNIIFLKEHKQTLGKLAVIHGKMKRYCYSCKTGFFSFNENPKVLNLVGYNTTRMKRLF